jgi:hypothetical protein
MSQENLEKLTEIFRSAGATDPASWASSEINEGINQLARFSFLKAISREVIKEDDLAWIDNQIEFNYAQPTDSGAQLVEALKEMLHKGVARESIVDLLRVIQFQTLWHVCCIIDKTYESDTPINQWSLFEVDDDQNPTREIGGLHESLYDFDPSGREMRPRNK